jgi:ribonucleotide monophosphatase NagD (HAD superfamily)
VLVIGDETGFPFLETVDELLNQLFRALDASKTVHLVLPNPDLIFPKDDRHFGIAAGSLAVLSESILRQRYPQHPALYFKRLGKPNAGLFAAAAELSGEKDMVMIGDQLATDIAGANAFGIDSVLMTTEVTPSTVTNIAPPFRPTYLMATL